VNDPRPFPPARQVFVLFGVAFLAYAVAVEPAAVTTSGVGIGGPLGPDGVRLLAAGFAAGVASLWLILGSRG